MAYTDATIKRQNEQDAAIEFIDFWKSSTAESPKMLIFDSKFTTYQNLSKLNEDEVKFLTLRRRSQSLIKYSDELTDSQWDQVSVVRTKGKKDKLKVHESSISLRNYEGQLRQIIVTDHGRDKPAFLITNDFDMSLQNVIRKYSRRWLVEQEIAEQIAFFHLNVPGSSIVVKVDFDLTMSLLAHNLYRMLALSIPTFEKCQAQTLHRKFIENGANIKIDKQSVIVKLKKKTHIPYLLEVPWIKNPSKIEHLGCNLELLIDSTS